MAEPPVFDQQPVIEKVTREEVRLIVREELSGLVRNEVAEGIRSAMMNVATIDVVQRMIESAVNPIKEHTTDQLHSVDRHLREAESRMTLSARGFDTASDKFVAFIGEMREQFGRLTTLAEENRNHIGKVENIQDHAIKQATLDRSELNKALERIDDLHADIHGDPDEPHHVSLYELIADGNKDRNEYHRETLDLIKPINDKLDTHDKYIASRKGMEMQLMQAGTKLLANKWTAVFIGLGLGAFLGLNISQIVQVIFK